LIESIIGRLLCTEAIIVCSYVWMSNHAHMQVFSLDCEALTHFHERLKKQLTDFLKRLLNLSQLNLWDNRTNIGELSLVQGISQDMRFHERRAAKPLGSQDNESCPVPAKRTTPRTVTQIKALFRASR
jgi:hypothetical protein